MEGLEIFGTSGRYRITADGQVWSAPKSNRPRWSRLVLRRTRHGYMDVGLRIDSKSRQVLVHRAVAQAYIPNPYGKPCINHKNGNKADNRVENLEWCTYSENMQHADRTGLRVNPKGSRANGAKLTEAQVAVIKKYPHIKGQLLALMFNVSDATVSNVKKGKVWGHVAA